MSKELEELRKIAATIGDRYFGINDLPEDWEEIEDGDFSGGGKWQTSLSIVSKNGKFFEIENTRTGSYYSDYYYETPEVYEVEQVEKVVTIVEWKRI